VSRRERWISRWVSATAVVAWVLANGLDVVSMLFAVQFGGLLTFSRYHPAESFLIYAGMRLLGTLAVLLVVIWVSRRWSSMSSTVWSALTAGALVTALVAWWRLYQ
jgi:hypothetical protein